MVEIDDEEMEEWEESGLPFWKYMIAGAMAGVAEHCVMFPMDTVKTRMQVAGSAETSLVATARGVVSRGGLRAMFRGVSAQFSGCGPAHAAYFSCYEGLKQTFIAGRSGHHPAAHAAAGGFATLAHDGLMTPFDVVKQRMQLDAADAKGQRYRHFIQCARGVYRAEGARAFFLSLQTTLVMNIPYQMCQFATYEAIKLALSREETAVEYGGAFTPIINFAAGGLAGGTAAAFTTPLDMVKTRLQTQGASGQRYGGALDAVRTIQAREGSAAFLKGMGPRVLFHVPSMAICWSTYESMKYLLT